MDDDVVSVESSGGMKQLSEMHGSYRMCKGWGLHPDWGPQMRCEKHGHEVLKDAHWLIGTRQHKQIHVAVMMSSGEGIPWGSPH